ncbi:MAG: 1-acyl-sn-glycerol-3-phosphate acyltransferase [Acholeplasmatales bacterium]|nr:1-acyl-sn-glycerol-3-phosphate acyltransferase [Acholeplasmatales bacterium]
MIILYLIGKIMAWPVQLIFFKKRIYYEDKKDTSRFIRGGALVVSNHRSLMDFMMAIFLFPFRKLYCLMSELIYSHGWIVSTLTTVMGGIKIDRRNYDFSFINKSVDMLNKNKLLAVYPEGKVNKNNGLLKFHPTYILIALKSGKPIIPIYTDGTYSIKKRTRVVIGKKIYLSDYCNSTNPTKEEIEYLNNIVKNKINELSKICKEEKNKDKYCQGLHFKYLFKDMGRCIAFIMNCWYRTKVYNKGKKKTNLKIKGGAVVFANHTSFADPLLCINAYWRRRIYIVAAEILFDNHPVRSKLLTSLGCVRVDRNINDIEAYQKILDLLKAGNIVVIYGPGHIDVGEKEEYKTGAALLAYKAGVPIYPIYINKRKKTSERFKLICGERYDINLNGKRPNEENLRIITNELKDKILKLRDDFLDGKF